MPTHQFGDLAEAKYKAAMLRYLNKRGVLARDGCVMPKPTHLRAEDIFHVVLTKSVVHFRITCKGSGISCLPIHKDKRPRSWANLNEWPWHPVQEKTKLGSVVADQAKELYKHCLLPAQLDSNLAVPALPGIPTGWGYGEWSKDAIMGLAPRVLSEEPNGQSLLFCLVDTTQAAISKGVISFHLSLLEPDSINGGVGRTWLRLNPPNPATPHIYHDGTLEYAQWPDMEQLQKAVTNAFQQCYQSWVFINATNILLGTFLGKLGWTMEAEPWKHSVLIRQADKKCQLLTSGYAHGDFDSFHTEENDLPLSSTAKLIDNLRTFVTTPRSPLIDTPLVSPDAALETSLSLV